MTRHLDYFVCSNWIKNMKSVSILSEQQVLTKHRFAQELCPPYSPDPANDFSDLKFISRVRDSRI